MNALLTLPFAQRIMLALAVAAAISCLATPFVKKLAFRIGAVDIPRDNRRMHTKPIPRLGGLSIVIAFLLCVLLFVRLERQMWGILVGSVIIFVMGILDDCLALPVLPRLIAEFGAGTLVVLCGGQIRFLSVPFFAQPLDLGLMAGPVTVFWIVLMTNAVNFIDGLDGLAAGVCCIASSATMVISLLLGNESVAVILAALLGACLGFLPFNFHPAQIFMGDTGSTFLGFVLASLSVQGMLEEHTAIPFLVPILILGVPFFDITFAIIRRLARGQNPMTPDRGHIHHRLIDMGLTQKQSVLAVYLLAGLLGVSAVLLANSGKIGSLIPFTAVFAVAVLGFAAIFVSRRKSKENPQKDEGENHG